MSALHGVWWHARMKPDQCIDSFFSTFWLLYFSHQLFAEESDYSGAIGQRGVVWAALVALFEMLA